MATPILAIIFGLILLVWSADRFISSSANVAQYFSVPSLLIGLLIVGFGTSVPEMLVSSIAAFDGSPELAIGNAIGSNIANTGLVLGVTALIAPIIVASRIIRIEIPILLGISLIFGYLISDGALTRFESVFLLGGLVALITWIIRSAYSTENDNLSKEVDQQLNATTVSINRSIFWLVVGLSVLLLSSKILVWGAVSIAEQLGMSSLVIGLTVVAFGTSLPELAASVVAARRGEHDIAIGNIVGSNMFNILAVTGLAGAISPMSNLSEHVLTRDWALMMFLSFVLMAAVYTKKHTGQVSRIEGLVLLLLYIGYTGYTGLLSYSAISELS